MKLKFISASVICMVCFAMQIQAQTALDCATLQKKVQSALTESSSIRISYTASDRNIYVDFERDANANTHLLVKRTGKEPSNQTVIKMGDKTHYAASNNSWIVTAPVWSDKIASGFPYEAWLDSCKSGTKTLEKPFSNCVLTKEVKITGTPYAKYSVIIESDTFKILLNKQTDKIETIQGGNKQKGISYGWDFGTPFTLSAPPTDLKEKPSFGFSFFPPAYSRDEYFDGNEPVYVAVDKLPEFKGGQSELFRFLGQNIKYPKDARKNGVEGTIYIGFVVEKDGSVTNLKLKRGVSPELNEEAMRVIKLLSGKWDAGWYGGQKVRVAYTLPTKFKLE